MKVAIELAPLITKLMEEGTLPLSVLQVLTLVKAHPGASQAELLRNSGLQYSRQALNSYIKKLTCLGLVKLTPDDPGAKNKQLWLTEEGESVIAGLEQAVVRTLRVS